jgi:hypothetical protein
LVPMEGVAAARRGLAGFEGGPASQVRSPEDRRSALPRLDATRERITDDADALTGTDVMCAAGTAPAVTSNPSPASVIPARYSLLLATVITSPHVITSLSADCAKSSGWHARYGAQSARLAGLDQSHRQCGGAVLMPIRAVDNSRCRMTARLQPGRTGYPAASRGSSSPAEWPIPVEQLVLRRTCDVSGPSEPWRASPAAGGRSRSAVKIFGRSQQRARGSAHRCYDLRGPMRCPVADGGQCPQCDHRPGQRRKPRGAAAVHRDHSRDEGDAAQN